MLTYYQPFLLPFLHRSRYELPRGIFQSHFLSFEDALWSILSQHKVPKKSVILIPSFYCMDVVENIKLHGYTPVFYPLDDNFQISQSLLLELVRKHTPRVLVLFHACGITNSILADGGYIQNLCKNLFVVEDCVHRLINPANVVLHHANHFVIDSVRKVSPLYGSFVYSKMQIAVPYVHRSQKEYSYIFRAHLLYMMFRVVFVLGVMLHSYKLVSFAHKHLLRFHDDLIGDSTYGYIGKQRYRFLHRYINFSFIEVNKKKQVELYERLLSPLHEGISPWYRVCMRDTDKKLLHVYPVGFKPRKNFTVSDVEKLLRDNRVPVWFKFLDSPWSKGRAVLFLPLGFHVTTKDIQRVCSLLTQGRHFPILSS